MEWGILVGLAIAVLAIGARTRLRRVKHQRPQDKAGNIYPLW
jgi:hypothetical protein